MALLVRVLPVALHAHHAVSLAAVRERDAEERLVEVRGGAGRCNLARAGSPEALRFLLVRSPDERRAFFDDALGRAVRVPFAPLGEPRRSPPAVDVVGEEEALPRFVEITDVGRVGGEYLADLVADEREDRIDLELRR